MVRTVVGRSRCKRARIFPSAGRARGVVGKFTSGGDDDGLGTYSIWGSCSLTEWLMAPRAEAFAAAYINRMEKTATLTLPDDEQLPYFAQNRAYAN